jgi:5-methylcytosine-specific restriction endonuclease McrA
MPNRSTSRSHAPAGRPRRRRRNAAGPGPRHTSLPTSRAAYAETRRWLLERHGAVCAYCERRVDAGVITLDHVTPRRGKDAYDRRDNLVLACPGCNAQKADRPVLAFLLARRERAASLLRYGQHLTPMLRDLAREVAGAEAAARAARLADPDYPYRD